jgi:hypothetical protein
MRMSTPTSGHAPHGTEMRFPEAAGGQLIQKSFP